jgi:hypothetical protein
MSGENDSFASAADGTGMKNCLLHPLLPLNWQPDDKPGTLRRHTPVSINWANILGPNNAAMSLDNLFGNSKTKA